jgi:hypothetical protein
MKLHFTCYADKNFASLPKEVVEEARECPHLDQIFPYTREDIVNSSFYKENRKILDAGRGSGFFLWKPFLIIETLKKINYGDSLLYMDCGDKFNCEALPRLKKSLESGRPFLVMGGEENRKWCKRDCFILLECDEEKSWVAPQLEAGFCAFMRTSQTESFLHAWLAACRDSRIITDDPNVCGQPNHEGFVDHRHDQAILSLLAQKAEITPHHRGGGACIFDIADKDETQLLFEGNVRVPPNA